ncbi:MAG: polysaccharide deacetylase family protein [Bacteroidia bacterium]|nr:polysaccharide deacetylase family protein [Bacteroidia bacterium]
MKNLKQFVFSFGLIIISTLTNGQEKKALAEQLGYPRDAKLLIVHMDDMGMSHSVNMAVMAAFKKNSKFSGSIMVPCPWFLEIAEFAKNHPELDIGIHATLTSEWKYFKWGGVLPVNEIPSLLAKEGYFYPTNEDVGKNAHRDEAEKEIRAQIEKAIAFGVMPTHIDTHMGSIGKVPEGSKIMSELTKEYISVPEISMDGGFALKPETAATVPWNEAYKKFIESMKPGLYKMIVHMGYDNDEMQAVTIWDRPPDNPNHAQKNWGSAWRQKDFDYLTSEEFKNLLKKNNVHLVTYKEINKLFSGNK